MFYCIKCRFMTPSNFDLNSGEFLSIYPVAPRVIAIQRIKQDIISLFAICETTKHVQFLLWFHYNASSPTLLDAIM